MRSTYPKSALALLTALFLLLLGAIGCQDNPVDAAEEAAADQSQADAAKKGQEDEDLELFNGPSIPFADTEVFFEFNSTDNDLGLQLFLDAEGWEKVTVTGPDKKKIVEFKAKGGLKDLGITELRFESAEPSPAEVLALFAPGTYHFSGKTVEGDKLTGMGSLSHDLPAPPTFTPSGGMVVDPEDTTVEWNAPGAELVEVIIEGEDGDFDVTVAADAEGLDVPPQFLEPGTEYKIEVLSIAENGNKTITESTFVTEMEND